MRIRFSFRLILLSMVLVIVAAGTSSLIAYQQSKFFLEKSLGDKLLAIVKTAAPLIDGDLHNLVYLNESGELENDEEFEVLRAQLVRIKNSNDLSHEGSPLYTVRKAFDYSESGALEFVVMTDKDSNGSYFIGNRYPSKPHIQKAMAGEPSATKVYTDNEGSWISAAAPILDSQNEIVGVLQADHDVHYFHAVARGRALRILLGALLSILLAGIIALLFSRSIVKPLEELIRSTVVFGQGNLEHRIELTRDDEIGDLAASFNAMAEQIQSKSAAMLEAQKKAEQASYAKSEFLANMSHEIRTPLNAITSLTRLLQYTELDDEQSTDVATIQSCAHTLTGIINDILDFSKIEAGKLVIDDDEFSVVTTIKRAIAQLDGTIRSKEQELVLEISPEIPERVIGDEMRLEQILRNLLSNAIKFTSEEGGIVVIAKVASITADEMYLQISVADSGIGIEESKRAVIFDAFAQAESSTTKKFGGTGLGLAICVRLVQQLGGKLWAESTPSIGSCFHFTVRLGIPKPKSVASEQKRTEVATALPTKRTETDALIIKARILLAEDNEINQDTIVRVLTKEGYAIKIANHGKEAIELVEQHQFDVILMDLHMPTMGGLEAATLIRELDGSSSSIPIIALTAHAVSGVRAQCFAAGMNGFIEKPIDYDKLLELLAKTTSQHDHSA